MAVIVDGYLVKDMRLDLGVQTDSKVKIFFNCEDAEGNPSQIIRQYDDHALKEFLWGMSLETYDLRRTVDEKIVEPRSLGKLIERVELYKKHLGKHDNELAVIYQEVQLSLMKLNIRLLQLDHQNNLKDLIKETESGN